VSDQEAFERALEALGHKERTQGELAEWLAARGFDADEVEATLSRLIEVGELDDARFARRYAEDKRELRGWGPERIRSALEARGIDAADIEAALGSEDHGDQLGRAVTLLRGRSDALDEEAGRARALAYLTRRGYDYEVAYDAVRRCEREAGV
jgi:regulatory protein